MKTISVVAAIIEHNQKFLATQRGYGDYRGGWEFPGGKVEPNETPEAALKREIQEELALNITINKLYTTIEYDYPNFHLSMQCYLCSVSDIHFTLLEHDDFRWLGRNELNSVEWLPADQLVANQLKN